ncbi:MAG: IS630 family transposase, partial [Candidatus Brocadiia bacterium]
RLWKEKIAGIDPSRFVFLDETGAKTNMTRLYARARKGERATAYAPQGHWHTTTLVAGLPLGGAVAPMVLDGAMDRLSFEAYVAQCLAPELAPGAIVIMDNLSAHKSAAIIQLIENAGATLWYLPPYSPDYNPIEQMWSKVKAALKRVCARTYDALEEAIALALDAVSPQDSQGFFRHCCVGIKC